MKRLFIGNLSYRATEAELQDWLTQAGFAADSVQIVRDRFSGESRGFGFIDFENDAEADRAVATCNGQEFLGRTLVVNEARPVSERGAGGGGRGPGGGGGRESRGGRGGGGGRDRY